MRTFVLLVLGCVLVGATAPSASADWFGVLTSPHHKNFLVQISDTQKIMPGRPFVVHVRHVSGQRNASLLVAIKLEVRGDTVSVDAHDQIGNKVTLLLLRHWKKPRDR